MDVNSSGYDCHEPGLPEIRTDPECAQTGSIGWRIGQVEGINYVSGKGGIPGIRVWGEHVNKPNETGRFSQVLLAERR